MPLRRVAFDQPTADTLLVYTVKNIGAVAYDFQVSSGRQPASFDDLIKEFEEWESASFGRGHKTSKKFNVT